MPRFNLNAKFNDPSFMAAMTESVRSIDSQLTKDLEHIRTTVEEDIQKVNEEADKQIDALMKETTEGLEEKIKGLKQGALAGDQAAKALDEAAKAVKEYLDQREQKWKSIGKKGVEAVVGIAKQALG